MDEHDVIGIGSPLLDITFEVTESFLEENGLKKGVMHLITRDQSKELLKKLENHPVKISPGGSSANTLAGISYLGGKSIFLGKIGNDSHGKTYEQKTKEEGVVSMLSKHPDEITGHAITFITPDYERTFATHLGASLYFRKENIPEDKIKDSKILHLEGYQIGDVELRKAVYHAANIAKENKILVSLDLSDAGLVKANLKEFVDFIKEYVDIVFANESEAIALTGKKPEEALLEISKLCKIAIVKLGGNGSIIRTNNITYKIPPYLTKIMNTNGAGDMYSAAFLYGIVNDWDIDKAGKVASYSASLVVGRPEARYGPELKQKVDDFISKNKL